MEPERARLAFVKHPASRCNEVQPVRPPGVRSFDVIVETVDERRELDSEFTHAGPGHIESFGFVSGAGEEHVVAYVGLHLPYVGRVRLKNVDRVEPNLVLVLLGELVQGGNLPPKWRSGIAPEDEDDRIRRPERAQLLGGLGLERLHCEVGGLIAGI